MTKVGELPQMDDCGVTPPAKKPPVDTLEDLIEALVDRLKRADNLPREDKWIVEQTAMRTLAAALMPSSFNETDRMLAAFRDQRDAALEGDAKRQSRSNTERELIIIAYARHLAPSSAPKDIGAARRHVEAVFDLKTEAVAKLERKYKRSSRSKAVDCVVSRGEMVPEDFIASVHLSYQSAVRNKVDMDVFAKELWRG